MAQNGKMWTQDMVEVECIIATLLPYSSWRRNGFSPFLGRWGGVDYLSSLEQLFGLVCNIRKFCCKFSSRPLEPQ
jgi:hypothetical protein